MRNQILFEYKPWNLAMQIVIFSSILSFWTVPTAYGDLSEKEVRKLQEKIKSFEHLNVAFTQKTYRSLRKKTSLSSGQAFFSKPNHFRWALETPSKTQWLYDGKTLSYFLPDKKQATTYPSQVNKGKELRNIVDMVLNFDELLKRFRILQARQNDHIIDITLSPLSTSEIKSADLKLDTKNGFMESIKLNLGAGNHTTIEFSNPRKSSIPESTYRVPKGTKISSAS
ncbi:MAG: outer membrane lipoprotein carrier protein LolA [Oligoflexales bacterium]